MQSSPDADIGLFDPVKADSTHEKHMHIRDKWLTLNIIFLIAAFVGIISITILSLWISGIFNTFSQLNTLGNHSVYHSEYALIKRCNWSMTKSNHFI